MSTFGPVLFEPIPVRLRLGHLATPATTSPTAPAEVQA